MIKEIKISTQNENKIENNINIQQNNKQINNKKNKKKNKEEFQIMISVPINKSYEKSVNTYSVKKSDKIVSLLLRFFHQLRHSSYGS